MIKATFLLGALVLTGCTVTPTEMRDAKPYASFISNKDPETLSKCIAHGLDQKSYAGIAPHVTINSIDDGFSVATLGNFDLVDIKKKNKSSSIIFYSMTTHTWVGPNQDRIDNTVNIIKECS